MYIYFLLLQVIVIFLTLSHLQFYIPFLVATNGAEQNQILLHYHTHTDTRTQICTLLPDHLFEQFQPSFSLLLLLLFALQ